jgi:hypothetical protein
MMRSGTSVGVTNQQAKRHRSSWEMFGRQKVGVFRRSVLQEIEISC